MKVDSNIPIPRVRSSTYPFHTMEIGDSVFYPLNGATAIDRHPAYMAAATIQKRHADYRFTGRTVIENDVRGIRIWRVPAKEKVTSTIAAPTLATIAQINERLGRRAD